MGKMFDSMLPEHEAFIRRQHLFLLVRHHLAQKGMSICRPKGMIRCGSFRQTRSLTWI